LEKDALPLCTELDYLSLWYINVNKIETEVQFQFCLRLCWLTTVISWTNQTSFAIQVFNKHNIWPTRKFGMLFRNEI